MLQPRKKSINLYASLCEYNQQLKVILNITKSVGSSTQFIQLNTVIIIITRLLAGYLSNYRKRGGNFFKIDTYEMNSGKKRQQSVSIYVGKKSKNLCSKNTLEILKN
jgi:hypothetical protein